MSDKPIQYIGVDMAAAEDGTGFTMWHTDEPYGQPSKIVKKGVWSKKAQKALEFTKEMGFNAEKAMADAMANQIQEELSLSDSPSLIHYTSLNDII